MNLWIELDDKLPYALTMPVATTEDEEDNFFYILDYFNAVCYNGEGVAGEMSFTLVPDKGEAKEALASGVIDEIPTEITVKVKEISSILASKR